MEIAQAVVNIIDNVYEVLHVPISILFGILLILMFIALFTERYD